MSDQQDPFEPRDDIAADTSPAIRGDGSGGIAWGMLLTFVGIALVIVFALQNTDPVPVKFLWLEGEFSLAIVILATAGVSVVLSELVAVIYRSRRKKRQAEKRELEEFRANSTSDE